ncbi:MAG: S8 family peptidase [Actinomycetota bacterium]|nr:S8 family peptidase [Actinomycetota bacterium]
MTTPAGKRGTLAVAALAAFASLIHPSAAASAEDSVAAQIKDSYIVVLDDTVVSASAVTDTARSLADKYEGRVGRTYSHALRGFSVTMSGAQAAKLATDPAVGSVEPDAIGHSADTQPNPPSWGLDRVDQRNLPLDKSYTYDNTASNVTAYIVDSGIRMTHRDLGGRAKSGYDFVDDDNDASDCLGHGTHVAGTVASATYGVAKGAKLVSVRILNCNDSATTADTLAGIDWVTANAVKPAVANFSLVFGSSAPTVENAIKKSIESGVVWTLSANNQGTDACQSSPAKLPEAITVGNTTITDARSSTSNYGSCLDIWAPGTNIISTSHQSDTGTRTMTGTSMAAPHVAGAAALYLAGKPTATVQQVRDALVAQASTVTVSDGKPGSPNKVLYAHSGSGDSDPEPTCGPFSNTADVSIPDRGAAVTSSITVTNCPGTAPAVLKVAVDIRHSWRGDLVIDLVAPDGTNYRLKNSANSDGADNVTATYTVNASSETANGEWKLKVQDVLVGDVGFVNSWGLTF